MIKKKRFMIIFGFILLLSLVSAYDYFPNGNVNMVGKWNVTNASVVETACLKLAGTTLCSASAFGSNRWDLNYTNMQASCGVNFVNGIYPNGTFRCGTVSMTSEVDPYWNLNYSAFNQSWSNTYNQTTNDSIKNYISSNNLQLMPFNKSVYGNFSFNGGWTNNGMSIIGGAIYAQVGYFYNLSYLSVSYLSINGSILPAMGFDNQFDIGNPSLRWKNLYLGGNINAPIANITGTLYVNDVNITERIASNNESLKNYVEWVNSTNTKSQSYPKNVNLTSGTYDGSFINGTKTGYNAGNNICNLSFSGSHLCDEFEVMQWFANKVSPNIDDDAWVSAGGPKYIPATVPVNDCNGWTYSGTVSYLGNYYHFNSTTGGDARALNCGTNLKLSCCSY